MLPEYLSQYTALLSAIPYKKNDIYVMGTSVLKNYVNQVSINLSTTTVHTLPCDDNSDVNKWQPSSSWG